ncbi:hypothetical protein MRB53_041263 [Persea americana]|nr:hypothetical protein MRB53_041263 [Persea americana]
MTENSASVRRATLLRRVSTKSQHCTVRTTGPASQRRHSPSLLLPDVTRLILRISRPPAVQRKGRTRSLSDLSFFVDTVYGKSKQTRKEVAAVSTFVKGCKRLAGRTAAHRRGVNGATCDDECHLALWPGRWVPHPKPVAAVASKSGFLAEPAIRINHSRAEGFGQFSQKDTMLRTSDGWREAAASYKSARGSSEFSNPTLQYLRGDVILQHSSTLSTSLQSYQRRPPNLQGPSFDPALTQPAAHTPEDAGVAKRSEHTPLPLTLLPKAASRRPVEFAYCA